MKSEMQAPFDIDVLHFVSDDTRTASSEEIQGLVVESSGLHEFLIDLGEVSLDMLTHKHGYTLEQLASSMLRCRIKHVIDGDPTQNADCVEVRISEMQLNAVALRSVCEKCSSSR